MKKLSNFKYIALLICCLPVLALIISHLTRNYRYSESNYIYSYGVLMVFILWFSSFILGFLNALFILKKEHLKIGAKTLWIIISLLPLLYIIIMLITAFVIDTFYNDDITLPNGEKIDGYYRGKM